MCGDLASYSLQHIFQRSVQRQRNILPSADTFRSRAGLQNAGGKSCSSLVSPESSVGGASEYAWHRTPAAMPVVHEVPSRPTFAPTQQQEEPSSHEQLQSRPQWPDLNSSQPGPIEINTSLLYTPQSGNSSTDVSHSGRNISCCKVSCTFHEACMFADMHLPVIVMYALLNCCVCCLPHSVDHVTHSSSVKDK